MGSKSRTLVEYKKLNYKKGQFVQFIINFTVALLLSYFVSNNFFLYNFSISESIFLASCTASINVVTETTYEMAQKYRKEKKVRNSINTYDTAPKKDNEELVDVLVFLAVNVIAVILYISIMVFFINYVGYKNVNIYDLSNSYTLNYINISLVLCGMGIISNTSSVLIMLISRMLLHQDDIIGSREVIVTKIGMVERYLLFICLLLDISLIVFTAYYMVLIFARKNDMKYGTNPVFTQTFCIMNIGFTLFTYFIYSNVYNWIITRLIIEVI